MHTEKGRPAPDLNLWEDVVFEKEWGVTPVQHNNNDCGVFMTRTIEYIARGALLDFTANEMNYFRRRMALEILKAELL